MVGLVVTLMLFVGVPLLLGARSRISRLEHRLRLVEEELRRRIAAGQEVLRGEAAPMVVGPTSSRSPSPSRNARPSLTPSRRSPDPSPPVEAAPAMAYAGPADG